MEKMSALKTTLDGVCSDSPPPSTVQQWSYPITWTSVPLTQFGYTNLQHAATLSFTIPSVVPSSAREVLIHAGVSTGWSDDGPQQFIKIFTQIGITKYEKYLLMHSYPQSAINTNSDNMWFPMPPNRRVNITLQTAIGGNAVVYLHAIGYR